MEEWGGDQPKKFKPGRKHEFITYLIRICTLARTATRYFQDPQYQLLTLSN